MPLAKKNFKFHAQVQKCHFGKIAKMALLNLCMKFKKFLAKSILLKHYENGNKKKYSQLVQGSPKSKRGFYKKGLARIKFLFLVLGSYESPEGLEC